MASSQPQPNNFPFPYFTPPPSHPFNPPPSPSHPFNPPPPPPPHSFAPPPPPRGHPPPPPSPSPSPPPPRRPFAPPPPHVRPPPSPHRPIAPPPPHITVEDDVHIDEEIKKNETIGHHHGLHAKAKSSSSGEADQVGNSSNIEVGTTSPAHEHHHQQLENKS
ncbi:Proline rich extensin signature [Sesbania bispinosa]|nr:Proline rich extensin signature [Sesbania bispinosa]